MRTVLFGLIVSFLLSSCIAANRIASDGNYYRNIGGYDCWNYKITGNGTMRCYNKDNKYTGTKKKMTQQEIMVWKMDDIAHEIRMND